MSKKLVMEFTFNMARLVIWARNCSCLDCLTVCSIYWTCRTHKKVTVELGKARWDSPSGFLLHRRVCQTFCLMQRKMTDKLPLQVVQFQNFCFSQNSASHSSPIGSRWIPQHYRRTLGDCPGSKMSLSILEFIYIILLRSLMELKTDNYGYDFP